MQLDTLTNGFLKSDIPEFKAGDTVVVQSKIKEGSKERVQAFEGVVIKRAGTGVAATFTVRKMSAGIGVERVFPVHSPRVVSIERKVEGFVRRSRIYYIRELEGKAARIKDMNIKRMESSGGAAEVKAKAKAAKAAKRAAAKAAAAEKDSAES
jgi:large subunit ribosomal protein L19